VTDFDLNPDGPHSPEKTAEIGDLFDQCSRLIVYATMADKHGLKCPADAYRLVADLYAATGRFPQMCSQLEDFLRLQASGGRLYEARGRSVTAQVDQAAVHLSQARAAAQNLTRALQAVQVDISGLGVKGSTDGQ
jgi:hypothetical protein